MQTQKEIEADLQSAVLGVSELLRLEAIYLANGKNGFDKQRLDTQETAIQATILRYHDLQPITDRGYTVHLMCDIILATKEYFGRQLSMKLSGYSPSSRDYMMKQKRALKALLALYKKPIQHG